MNPDSLYAQDIEKTLKDDNWVERFLEWNSGDVKKTVDGIIFSLQFQKQHRVRDLKDTDFPEEFHESLFVYQEDRLSRKTMYTRMSRIPMSKDKRDWLNQFALFMYFKAEETRGDRGYINIQDYKDVSLTSLDMDLIYSMIALKDIFPASSSLFITVNVPFYAKTIYNTIKYALPCEQRKGMMILSESELQQVVHKDNLPKFLGGKCLKETTRFIKY